MVQLYTDASFDTARCIAHRYSPSLSSAISLLHPTIRDDIYGIVSFVRLVSEVVDSFLYYPQDTLFAELSHELAHALTRGISTNPVVHAFVQVVRHYQIEHVHIDRFMASMRSNLSEQKALTKEEFTTYIEGSAEAVALMCLCVFTQRNTPLYNELQQPARALGAAIKKVNLLRNLKCDYLVLDRIYFPQFAHATFTNNLKREIEAEITNDFDRAYLGIVQLPSTCQLGVTIAYNYYKEVLQRIVETPIERLMCQRIEVNNIYKTYILIRTLCFKRWGAQQTKQKVIK